MVRLPTVGGDDGTWGTILRDFIMKEHLNDDNNGTASNGGHQKITIKAGTTSAGTAPIKFASGPLMTSAEAGAMEYNGDYFLTDAAGRKRIAIYDDISGATGDIYYRDGTGVFKRLPIGSTNEVLTVSGGIPTWSSTLASKTLDNTNTVTLKDTNFTLQDEGTTSKQLQFNLSAISASTTRTISVPNVSGTMYVSGGTDVSVADGGTGRSTSTTAYGIIAAGTTATGAQQTIDPGTSGQFLKSSGAAALASFANLQLSDLSDASSVVTITGAQTLTNKSLTSPTLTGTTSLGGALDFTPDTGTVLSFDGKAAITRHGGGTSNSMGVGADDTLFLGAGESRQTMASNITGGSETVEIGGDTGVNIHVSTDNWANWANRKTTAFTGTGITWDGNAVWHAGNDGAGSGLDADTVDGLHASSFVSSSDLLTVSESLRANRGLIGGGVITVDASSNVSWSARLLVIANGRGSNYATDGYFEMLCPTSGTITGVGGSSDRTATAAGVNLGSWEALYYILPLGSGHATVAANYRVVTYTSNVDIPHNWLLICVKNGDNSAITFNNGITLSAGESMNSIQQNDTNSANTLVRRDGSGNFSAGTITASLSGNATTATTLQSSRTIQTNLASGSSASFNGSANITPGVTGVLGVSNGGTGMTSLSNFSQLVVTTQAGSTGTENGANTWAQIATFSTGTNQYSECQLTLSVNDGNSGSHDTTIVSVYFRSNSTSSNPTVDVTILAKGGSGSMIVNDSFKVISDGWSSDMQLWFKKGGSYGQFNFYEISQKSNGGTLTYTTNPAWQSATPTGAVRNVSSDGVYSGLKFTANGTVSGTQLVSSVSTGTAPLTVSSSTKVTNLNADLLDGMDATSANTASTIVARDSNGDFAGRYINSQYVNMSHSAATRSSDTVFYSSTDDYIRKNNTTGFKTSLALQNVDNTSDATKNVLSATKLTTARTIGGVSFDGTANISLPGVNTTGSQNTTGSAAKLTTARNIQVNLGSTSAASFDGSANITPGITGTLPVASLGTGKVVGSNNGSPTSLTLWKGTQAQYDALGSWDSNTVYVVTS